MRHDGQNTANYIKKLEKANLIHVLDLEAFEYALQWSIQNKLPCASNFSAKSLGRNTLVNLVTIANCDFDLLNEGAKEKAFVKLELTENKDLSKIAIENLKMLAGIGWVLSLDDYGSQFNGINRWYSIPFAEIKIDRFLISELQSQKAIAIVESTLDLGDRLNCTVVAEGIEEQWQFDLLVDLGFTRFQGYYFHKPEPLLVTSN